MVEFWNKFIFQFCKVEFACWNGEPNWLGWILIGIGGLILLGIALVVLAAIRRDETPHRRQTARPSTSSLRSRKRRSTF